MEIGYWPRTLESRVIKMKINPRETEIFGYESPACLELIISLMIGMMEKDSIPPVKLCTFDEGKTFEIPYETEKINLEGGHHRSLAFYLLGEDLDIEVVENKFKIPLEIKLSLYDINLKTNSKTFRYEKDIMNKEYRELPDSKVFFEKYPKINLALKYGTHSNYSLDKEAYKEMIQKLTMKYFR